MTVDDLKSHDDYESFASYLGVDYEDYIELVGEFEVGEDEVEYALTI